MLPATRANERAAPAADGGAGGVGRVEQRSRGGSAAGRYTPDPSPWHVFNGGISAAAAPGTIQGTAKGGAHCAAQSERHER